MVQRRAGDGERKRVTVLFADLEGSTAAIEDLDPDAALGQIEPAVQIMMVPVCGACEAALAALAALQPGSSI